MSTQNATTTPTTTPASQATAKRTKKSWNVALNGATGESVRISAKKRSDGTAVTFVVRTIKVGKKKTNERGLTEPHPTLEAALAKQKQLVAAAQKMGWTIRETKQGFERKPDAFTALPAPTKANRK